MRGAICAAIAAAALAGAWFAVTSLATTTGPIEWTSPTPIVPASLLKESGTQFTPAALSCRGVSLCVAVTEGGDALASVTPSVSGGTWDVTLADASHGLTAVACPSTSLCVAADRAGDILTSEDPEAASPAWTEHNVDGTTEISAMSCPSMELCVAADTSGRILVSEAPSGGPSAWHSSVVDGANAPIFGLACPSSSLCVAADNFGNVLTTEEPAGGPGAWTITHVDGQHQLTGGVSCPSEAFCATTDSGGNLVASTNPRGGASAWNVVVSPPGQHLGLISCATASLCVATEAEGRVAVTTEPAGGSPQWRAARIDEGFFTTLTCNPQLTCLTLDSAANGMIGGGLPPTEPLGVSLAGTGHGTVTGTGISCPPSCNSAFPTGNPITLTATPSPGSGFAGWSGSCTGTGTCSVTMDSPRSVTAVFTANGTGPHVTLSVSIGGLGRGRVTGPGIACPDVCAVSIAPDAVVPLRETPAKGATFGGWGGAAHPCKQRTTCVVTMQGSEEVKASFTTAHPTLRVLGVAVNRRRRSARIEFAAHRPVSRVACTLTRMERARRRLIRRDRHCRTPVSYTHLSPGAYVFTAEGFHPSHSTPAVTVTRRIVL
jgi:hypothetical protein